MTIKAMLVVLMFMQIAPVFADGPVPVDPVCEHATTAAVNQLIASYGVAVTVSFSATPDAGDYEVGGTLDNGCIIEGAADGSDTIVVYGTDTTTDIVLKRFSSRAAAQTEANEWLERPFREVVWGKDAVAFIRRY
jgi:hypothetical protein